jgi:adenylate cyclase
MRAASSAGEAERWRRSPLYKMLQTGDSLLRLRLNAKTVDEFSWLDDLLAAGMTEYVAIITRFATDGVIGEMDGLYSNWATSALGGFDDGHIAAIEHIAPYCPSSDDLRPIRHFAKGGSDSSGVRV